MFKSTIDYNVEKFLVNDESVMKLAIDVSQILNKINKITIKGKGESCPATVSVANIITQNMLNSKTKTEQILLGSESDNDGRLISTIEIVITKISSQ